MDDNLKAEIQARIDRLAVGERFKLTNLLHDIWFDLGDGDARVGIGKAFSRAVRTEEVRRCRRFGLIDNDRDTYYERI